MINLTYSNQTRDTVDETIFEKLLPKIQKRHLNAEGEISLTIVDDKTIQELNREYRGKDKPTDVISFAYSESEKFPGENMLGEIYISIETAKRQSEDLDRELKFLFIHGVLHLLGYTHETDEKYSEMMEETEEIIRL